MSKDEFDSRLKEFKLSRANDENFLRFDEKQKDAIFSIVNGVHGNVPYVLWGPPGFFAFNQFIVRKFKALVKLLLWLSVYGNCCKCIQSIGFLFARLQIRLQI